MPTRSIVRAARRAFDATWNSRTGRGGHITAVIVFPAAGLGAPPWTPGPGFRAVSARMWWKPNTPDRPYKSGTVVIADVVPKEMPSRTGGPWTLPEVWTVALDSPDLTLATVRDKSHRITWAHPDKIIDRSDFPDHPAAAVSEFYDQVVGFEPDLDGWLDGNVYGGRPYLALQWTPDDLPTVDLDGFAAFIAAIATRYRATVRMYPAGGARFDDRCPVTASWLHRVDGLLEKFGSHR